ncbi:hypothetical protein [Nocardia farcinica]|nr:hypothetical protein [Nocardia farcinica]
MTFDRVPSGRRLRHLLPRRVAVRRVVSTGAEGVGSPAAVRVVG